MITNHLGYLLLVVIIFQGLFVCMLQNCVEEQYLYISALHTCIAEAATLALLIFRGGRVNENDKL